MFETSTPRPEKSPRHALRPVARALALEPRLLFDGAGAVAAADHFDAAGDHAAEAHKQDTQPAAEARPSEAGRNAAGMELAGGGKSTAGEIPLLNLTDSAAPFSATLSEAARLALQSLESWLQSGDHLAQAAEIFSADAGSAAWNANLQALREEILSGRYDIRVEARTAAELQDVLGAYSTTGTTGERTLYLNAGWLAKADAEQVAAVLLEEIGHDFDDRLNGGKDSAGDEGHAFASLLVTGDANLEGNQARTDHQRITLDGVQVSVETALGVNIVQTHFVPLSEKELQDSLKGINSAVKGNMETIIAISATSNGTVVVYDHWEDGYESDPNNPLQATTKVWGYNNGVWFNDLNGNGIQDGGESTLTTGNGIAEISGATLILRNSVNPSNLTAIDYDGRDLIGSNKAISVTRAGWSATPGTVLGGAVNVIDAANAGKMYTIPVGQGLDIVKYIKEDGTQVDGPAGSTNGLFLYTSAHIIATQNNTTVQIDKDGDGNYETTVVLAKGQTYLVNGGVAVGGHIQADKGINVYVVGGNTKANYENRWLTLTPDEQWSNSYYAPVSTTKDSTPAGVILYNPNSYDITVHFETANQTGSFTIAAGAYQGFLMPKSAAHFYTDDLDDKFFATGVIDAGKSGHATHDWSYSLIPESYLTDRAVVGLGWGSDGNGQNYSPVWITPTGNTTVYVEGGTSISVKDGNGNAVAVTNEGGGVFSFQANNLQSYRILDSDKNQSGLSIYTKDGTLITGAWGQDPSVAVSGAPALDMGSALTPYPDYVLSKSAIEKFANGDPSISNGNLVIEMGEQVQYTVRLTNRAVIDLYNIKITDQITPADSADYVADSLTLNVYDTDGTTKLWSINKNEQTFFGLSEAKKDALYSKLVDDEHVDAADVDVTDNGDGTWTLVYTFDASNPMNLGGADFKLDGGYIISDLDPSTVDADGLKRGGVVEFTYVVTICSDINKSLADENYVVNNTVTMTAGDDPSDPDITKVKDKKVDLGITDGEVFFLKNDGSNSIATSYEPGETIKLRVVDGDQNKNKSGPDTLWVRVSNGSEYEFVELTETGANTGIFEGTLNTVKGSSASENGALGINPGNEIKVEYVDPYLQGLNTDNPTVADLYDSSKWKADNITHGGIDNYTNPGISGDFQNSGVNNNVKTATIVNSALSVNDIVVNEASKYGVFEVTARPGDTVTGLSLQDGTARGGTVDNVLDGSVDYRNDKLQFSTDGGSTWANYTGQGITVPNDGKFLVRTEIINDKPYEGAETFELIAATASSTATGTATILDDGTGNVWEPSDPGDPDNSTVTENPPGFSYNDDRVPTVSNPVVQESSGTMMFEVKTHPNGTITGLVFDDDSALVNDDYGSGGNPYQWSTDGVTWTDFTPGTNLNLTASAAGLLYVKTSITIDGDVEPVENFTLTATIAGGNNATGTGTILDTPPPEIDNVVVNEGSGWAVFTVTNTDASDPIHVWLETKDGTAKAGTVADVGNTTGDKDYLSDSIQYWDGDDSEWKDYDPTDPPEIAASGTLKVRIKIVNDHKYEGSETFQLEVQRVVEDEANNWDSDGSPAALGTAIILDDGTGTVWEPSDPDNPDDPADPLTEKPYDPLSPDGVFRDDDRTPTINNPVVNEGSPYVVFEVKTEVGATITGLTFTDGTAKGGNHGGAPVDGTVDYDNSALEYSTDGGSTWTVIAPAATGLGIVVTDGTLLVRTKIVDDESYEVSEQFKLTATTINGKSATGTATILDDGTGTVFDDDGTDKPGDPRDDDRIYGISVNNPTVNEASSHIVFEVYGDAGVTVSLEIKDTTNPSKNATGSATGPADPNVGDADYRNDLLQYSTDGGSTWVDYDAGNPPDIPPGGKLLVRVQVFQDNEYEASETLKLEVTAGSHMVTGIGTIKDDGTGYVWVPNDPLDPDTPLTPSHPDYVTPDDDRGLAISISHGRMASDAIGNYGDPAEGIKEGRQQYTYFEVDADTQGESGPFQVNLALGNGATDTATIGPFTMDYSTDGGVTWTRYTWNGSSGNRPSVTDLNGTILVRVDISSENDDIEEPNENFTLTASYADSPAIKATGNGIIIDKSVGAPTITPNDENNGKPTPDEQAGHLTVYEKGLTSTGDTSETASGKIVVTADDGVASITVGDDTFTLADLKNPGVVKEIDTGKGTLRITGISNETVSSGKTTGFDLEYTYTLHTRQDHSGGGITDTVQLEVSDEQEVNVSSVLNITIINDVPTAVADSHNVATGTALTVGTAGGVLGNDRAGADGWKTGGGVIGVVAGNGGTPTTGVGSVIVGAFGKLTLNANGSYTYEADPNTIGMQDVFTYQVEDGDGDRSTATLTINIVAPNSVPIATPDSFSMDSGSPLTGDLSGNDTLGDGAKSAHTWSKTSDPANGTVTVNPDGSFVYTPNTGFAGTDTFTYTVTDEDGDKSTATVTITVNGVPVAVDDNATTKPGTPVSGNLAGNDTPSPDGGNVWSKTSDPANGTVTVNPDGSYTYTPDPGFSGTDSFTYTVTDKDGDKSTATVTIRVSGVPVAVDDNVTTKPGTPVSGNLGGNDTPSPDGGNVWSKTSDPSNGTVTVAPDGSYTYTPAPDFSGTDSFTYTVTDKDGDKSTATVIITIDAGGGQKPGEGEVDEPNPDNPELVDPNANGQRNVPPPAPISLQPVEPGEGPRLQPEAPLQSRNVFDTSPVVLDAGPYFAGERHDNVRRMNLPFHPIVYVNREVVVAQQEREPDDARLFSRPGMATAGDVGLRSLGMGLGQDSNLFVVHSVRDSQQHAGFLGSTVDGRLGRVQLNSDASLPGPDLGQTGAGAPADATEPAEADNRAAADEAAPRAEADDEADEALAAAAAPDFPRVAPSFAEQLRGGAGRLPLAARRA